MAITKTIEIAQIEVVGEYKAVQVATRYCYQRRWNRTISWQT